jgi:hypothetical protein
VYEGKVAMFESSFLYTVVAMDAIVVALGWATSWRLVSPSNEEFSLVGWRVWLFLSVLLAAYPAFIFGFRGAYSLTHGPVNYFVWYLWRFLVTIGIPSIAYVRFLQMKHKAKKQHRRVLEQVNGSAPQ